MRRAGRGSGLFLPTSAAVSSVAWLPTARSPCARLDKFVNQVMSGWTAIAVDIPREWCVGPSLSQPSDGFLLKRNWGRMS